jgi:hypothetical protein
MPEDVWATGEERKHGRVERREARSVTDIGWLNGKDLWKDLKTIIQYRSWRSLFMPYPIALCYHNYIPLVKQNFIKKVRFLLNKCIVKPQKLPRI